MFDKEFYPTPRSVIERMLRDIQVYDKVFLEPSAGKGNISDYLNELGAKQVLTFEKNKDLRQIVQAKSKCLGGDFLECQSNQVSHIDYIVMNPPFSNADKHIIHAWQVAPEGCHIIAICNSDTLRNDYTRTRKQLLSLITEYGDRTENLEDCFSDAERKTNVGVTLINLFKPIVSSNFGFDEFFIEEDDEEVIQGNGIAKYNEIRAIVNRYVSAVKCFDEFSEVANRMNDLVNPIGFGSGFTYNISYNQAVRTKEEFSVELQKASWKWIFEKTGVKKYVTSKVEDELNKFVEQQSKYPFTMRNIYKMFEVLLGTSENTINDSIIDIFDTVTKYYHENRYNLEGWKTNSHYILNKKFIFPGMVSIGWHSQPESNHYSEKKIDDFNKVLAFLAGVDYNKTLSWFQRLRLDNVLVIEGEYVSEKRYKELRNESDFFNYDKPMEFDSVDTAKEFAETYFPALNYTVYKRPEWGKWEDWNFFEFRCYKKGTVHFRFKDEKLWQRFNERVAKIKGFALYEKV